jgi:hypothetical protein
MSDKQKIPGFMAAASVYDTFLVATPQIFVVTHLKACLVTSMHVIQPNMPACRQGNISEKLLHEFHATVPFVA